MNNKGNVGVRCILESWIDSISYSTKTIRGLSEYLRGEEIHITHIRIGILNIKPSVRNLGVDEGEEDSNPTSIHPSKMETMAIILKV